MSQNGQGARDARDPQGAGRPTVVVTGGAGHIGTYLRTVDGGLAAHGWQLHLVDATPADDLAPGERFTAVDLTTPEADARLEAAMAGADAVVHLAAIPSEDDFWAIRQANIDGTFRVFDAARRAGVRRVVFASSNHAVGFYPAGDPAPVDGPVRPDGYYGLSKAFGEALGSLYADKYGLEVVSLRIGACFGRPGDERGLAIWLSPGDAVRLVAAALSGPVDGHTVVYGISANTRAWWDLGAARALGYDPQDDSEAYAEEAGPAAEPAGLVGGPFALEHHPA
ncbi:NAD-dependent epimerase/dehydratase family protein [Georgenia faecalis]|uniref:NAD-dependent epimerase/dehydratase family protein n=1 Tax=Georgenia faecalis TaxID=2483799 RepID=UPI000FD8AC9B|nr:NAD(P)-dependent oxidoreductase [Georgenia faecalis]